MGKIKLTANVLFAGIGCQERGIQNTGLFDLEVINTSEINKESILSYAAIHNGLTMDMIKSYNNYPSVAEMKQELIDKNIGYDPEKNKPYDWNHKRNTEDVIKKYWLANHLNHNLGDISKIQSLTYADLWTVSFPCQSISCAGKMKGFKPDSGTRSSLLWENIRLLKKALDDGIPPKYIMFENVKNLISKTFKNDFLDLLDILKDLHYNSYWKVLNAKECGIPQNRERVFVICIREDIDKGTYDFPQPFPRELELMDILHEEVDEKYYLSGEKVDAFIKNLIMDGKVPDPNNMDLVETAGMINELEEEGYDDE